jgi:hypothetical protein
MKEWRRDSNKRPEKHSPFFFLSGTTNRVFSRVRRFVERAPAPIDIQIQGLTQLEPVKPMANGHALNKAGRLVLKGLLHGRPVKIYEAHNGTHASFIADIAQRAEANVVVHEVIEVRDALVIAEWVQEGSEQELDPAELADINWKFHCLPVKDRHSTGFDYWNDFILPRFRRAAAFLGEGLFAQVAEQRVRVAWSRAPVVMHPDVTPVNIVRDLRGELEVIDNELLTAGGMPLLDVCNTAHSLPDDARDIYTQRYAAISRCRPTEEEFDTLNCAWLARKVGSAFVQGNIVKASNIISRYKRGDVVMPAALRALRGTTCK